MDDSMGIDIDTDNLNPTVEEATKKNEMEPSKGMLKTPSTALRFQVAPVSAGKIFPLLVKCNAWLMAGAYRSPKPRDIPT